MTDRPKLLELRNIHASYGNVTALDGVDFDLYSGEIHGLVGEHRAGKSTLVKALSGAARVDDGTIIFEGQKVDAFTPKSSVDRRIGIVYQDLSIIPHLDAVENIFTGRMLRRGLRRLDHNAMKKRASEILGTLGCTFDLRVPLAKLKQVHQHMVEFARALAIDPKVLILDELGNKLTPVEMRIVYRTILDLRERGCGIIYISHDMDEILRLADRVTVLRDGHRRLTTETKGLDRLRLFELTYTFSLQQLQSVHGDTPLQRLKRDLQSVIQIFPVGVVLLDEKGAIQLYNLAAHELCSLDGEGVDRSFSEILSALAAEGGDGSRAADALTHGEPLPRTELRLRTGKTVAISGALLRSQGEEAGASLLVIEDVSLDRYVNDFVVENAKMSTVAQLAVGVAHEVNNPLFAIQNYLEVIRTRNVDAEIDERIARIEREVVRISEIASSLLSFSRVASRPRGIVDVRDVIENAVILLQHSFREKAVDVDLDLPSEPVQLQGDENRITQVILNLASNAFDAVLSGGRIRMAARRAPDGWAEISVSDDGCGIPEDLHSRIFDPFFTTKLSRKNTGLGLSICRNIIEEHGGTIGFESRPGSGTTFLLRLPREIADGDAPSNSDALRRGQKSSAPPRATRGPSRRPI
jgi:signal transduction histidine kinase/ABC-type branched-subunit amino acid transport system ATPase component